MEPIDRKFIIHANCFAHGHTYTEADGIFFKAADSALPGTLKTYREEAAKIGADDRQLRGIDLLIERVNKWREENPDKCKVPDIDPGVEESIVNKPNE